MVATRAFLLALALSLPARADEAPPAAPLPGAPEAPASAPAPAPGVDPAAPAVEPPQAFPVEHVVGPVTGKLGGEATVSVPDKHLFIEQPSALKQFFEITQNVYDSSVKGILLPPLAGDAQWWVVFQFQADGYVKDEDKDDIDADAILETLQKGTEAGNASRRERGWDEIKITGWHTKPKYDQATHNLEWATIVESKSGKSVNYEVRLLGRRGVMSATLIDSPEAIAATLPALRAAIGSFTYVAGEDYGSYQEGDKVAEYTLAALIGGGTLALAAKTGILQKFWKFIVAGFVALAAGVKRLFSRKKGE